jgi:predicted ArsR family transcriptional regulator
MAVRQHLYALRRERLVTYEEEPRPMGRPAKLWRLTPEAERFFPDSHAALATGLIGAMARAFGRRGMDRLLRVRVHEQTSEYRRRVPARGSLHRRLRILADLRTAEGYMAEVRAQPDGSFLLIENHCPISAAARACQGLCAGEIEVFRRLLGPGLQVDRTEHILAGARRCAYRVSRERFSV